jgi:hypothetical protein
MSLSYQLRTGCVAHNVYLFMWELRYTFTPPVYVVRDTINNATRVRVHTLQLLRVPVCATFTYITR